MPNTCDAARNHECVEVQNQRLCEKKPQVSSKGTSVLPILGSLFRIR